MGTRITLTYKVKIEFWKDPAIPSQRYKEDYRDKLEQVVTDAFDDLEDWDVEVVEESEEGDDD